MFVVDLNDLAAAGVHGEVILGSVSPSLVQSFSQLKTRIESNVSPYLPSFGLGMGFFIGFGGNYH